MAKEILKEEILNDEQLDQVAGGTYGETFADMDYVTRYTGIQFHGSDSDKREKLRDLLWSGGIQIKDHGGATPNEYFIVDTRTGQKGPKIDREDALYRAVMKIRYDRGM
ncbi:MAG: hypothetical protein IKN16_02205 [Selenomonadaceae bacterium]|nr:hypothetical protein [Selenomonadaceae bacterium]